MRKLLLITSLYPSYAGESINTTSYALHEIVSLWNSLNLSDARVTRLVTIRKFLADRSVKLGWHKVENVSVYNHLVINIPKTNIRLLRIQKLIQALRKQIFIPDVVLAHINDSFDLAYRLATVFGSKLVLGLHNSDVKWLENPSNVKKFHIYCTAASQIACRSKSIHDKVSKMFPEYADRMFVAHSGISEKLIESKEFFLEKAEAFDRKDIAFATASMLIPLKNIDVNLRALSRFRNFKWKYFIMGDGPCMRELKSLAKELDIEDRVVFLGHLSRNDVLRKLRETNVFLMVSAPETFGLAYLEAMAKANIVVGARGWGIDGIVEDSINGFLVEPRSIDELVRVIDKLFQMSSKDAQEILLNTYDTITKNTDVEAAKNYLNNIINYQG